MTQVLSQKQLIAPAVAPEVTHTYELMQLVVAGQFEKAIELGGSVNEVVRSLSKFKRIQTTFLDYEQKRSKQLTGPLKQFSSTLGKLFAYDHFDLHKQLDEPTEDIPEINAIQYPGLGILSIEGQDIMLANTQIELNCYQLLIGLIFKSYFDRVGEYILCPTDSTFQGKTSFGYIKIYLDKGSSESTAFLREKMMAILCRKLRISVAHAWKILKENQAYVLTADEVNPLYVPLEA
jgi:CRISPR/Cas system-associated protein Csx1